VRERQPVDTSTFFRYPDPTTGEFRDESVFLPSWRDDEWAKLLAYTETQRFRAGELVIQVGEGDRALYIVARGALEVVGPDRSRQGEQVLSQIGVGSIMGEVAFLDGGPRSANVRAMTDGDVLRLSYQAFQVFAANYPDLAQAFLLDLSRILAGRLRRSNDLLFRG
jgi:CRP/FNR family transcriptional regulator, cyclic AMP receptor protein